MALVQTPLYRTCTTFPHRSVCFAGRNHVCAHSLHFPHIKSRSYRTNTISHPVRLHLPGTNPILIQGTPNIRRLLKSSSHTNPSHAQTFIASQLLGMPKRAAQLFQQYDSGYAATPLPNSRVEGKNRKSGLKKRISGRFLRGRLRLLRLRPCVGRYLWRRWTGSL